MIKGGRVPRMSKYELALKQQVDQLRKENKELREALKEKQEADDAYIKKMDELIGNGVTK